MTKSASQESSVTVESTSDSVARNWSCVMSTIASVADGLRLLARFAMSLSLDPRTGANTPSCGEGTRGHSRKQAMS